MLDQLITCILFNITLFLIPVLIGSFFVLKFARSLWLNCISIVYPEVEFVRYSNIRTLLDTHRNQGIISLLLNVKGPPQPDAVHRHLQEVVSRRDKSGNYTFPRLRQCLITKCGNYAWEKRKFNLDQNLTVAPFTYKGRAVTEFNIQEYVSEIVSKYLPSGIPPWQVTIIPSSEDHHYILIKLHHLMLNEGLNVGDLLPLIPPTRQSTGNFVSRSPLVDVVQKPKYIPQLKEKLTEELNNRWNEFVANYDPLEQPELFKITPTFFQFLAICLITLVNIVKECKRGFRVIKEDYFSRMKYFLLSLDRETKKRQVNFEVFIFSIIKSLDPRYFIAFFLKTLLTIILVIPVKFPFVIYRELQAIYACVSLTCCPYQGTFIGIFYTYIPLIYNSIKEIFKYLKLVYHAPKNILEDILLQPESLQTITLCGRKSVAWSESIPLEVVRNIAKNSSVTETEIILNALSSSISKYFIQTNQVDKIPETLPITIRNINTNYIFATGTNIRPEDSMSGILCLNLPIINGDKTIFENLLEIKSNFHATIQKQGISHFLTVLQTKYGLLTKFLPNTFLAVYLKYLSRKYPVTVTEITNRYPNVRQKTLWGQEVNDVIYWRPPQANTSISLCINEYANHVKLGVMCDAQLVPHHTILARTFPETIQDMAKILNFNE